MKRLAVLTLFLAIVAYLAAAAYRVHSLKYDIWLPSYVHWWRTQEPPRARPVHLLVVVVDHFEPDYYAERIFRWETGFPALATAHRDHYGRVHQHTWFYPGEQIADSNLSMLKRLVGQGFGEVELHYHHYYDTYASFRKRMAFSIESFQRYGFLKTIDGQTRFGFIHGNGALDNSEGAALCGVDEELRLLLEMGCYADFTFPEIWQNAQPRSVNSIFEAADDPSPKSYDRALPLGGSPTPGQLVIFQGPLIVTPNLARLFVHVEDGDIHPASPPSPSRADLWVRAGIHVPQRPEWVFVKLFGHGATSDADIDVHLSSAMDRTLSYLEHRYNDGEHYVLHYVTAREAYNVARAAAAGKDGDPRQYYDYEIKPYVADAVAAGFR